MPQPWMIFQATSPKNAHNLIDVHYIWNGSFAICIRDSEGLPPEERGWTGKIAEDLSDQEIEFLNEVAANKRKRSFTLPRNGRVFRVTARGVFSED